MSHSKTFDFELVKLFEHDSTDNIRDYEKSAAELALLMLPGRCFCDILNNDELYDTWMCLTGGFADYLSNEQITTLINIFIDRMKNGYWLFPLNERPCPK